MNWRDGESNPKISAALKIEHKISDLNIAFDRYASRPLGTEM